MGLFGNLILEVSEKNFVEVLSPKMQVILLSFIWVHYYVKVGIVAPLKGSLIFRRRLLHQRRP